MHDSEEAPLKNRAKGAKSQRAKVIVSAKRKRYGWRDIFPMVVAGAIVP